MATPMRVMPTIHPCFATLLLLASACAGAEMGGRASGADDIGNSGLESSESTVTAADGSVTAAASTTDSDDSGDDAPSSLDASATDPTDTDPTDTDPSDTDPSDTDPSTTDTGATDTGATDPSTTDGSVSDSDPSTTDGGTSDDGATTDTAAPDAVDLSGYVLLQANSFREIVLPEGTIVPVGGLVVVGRNASPGTFQDFWGVNWGDDVVYVEGLDDFPVINGAETYTLLDAARNVVDGPSPALTVATSAARVDATLSGSDASAWEVAVAPNSTAVPGLSAATGGTSGVPYISEYADTTGNGNFDFEFVELHIPL